jgi:hypothetical protein
MIADAVNNLTADRLPPQLIRSKFFATADNKARAFHMEVKARQKFGPGAYLACPEKLIDWATALGSDNTGTVGASRLLFLRSA